MKLKGTNSFIPYLVLVFFNTFIDVGHKILIQDTLYQTANSADYTIYSAIINGLILLPYILLFTPSGFIADRFSKASVLRVTAAAAIPLTLLVCWCYYQGYFWGAYGLTLLLAIQSVMNSPAKYGYIKEIFGKEQLTQINAIVQTLTIIAILAATFVFTSLFSHFIQGAGLKNSQDKTLILQAFAPMGFLLVVFSTFETLMTFRLVKNAAVDPNSTYEIKAYFKGKYLQNYLEKARHPKVIFSCIVGLSLFWAINQVLLASYGAYLKEHVGNVGVLFAQGSLAIGGIGILLGALYAGKVSKGFIETGLIPVATIGITVGLFILPLLSGKMGIVCLFLIYGFFGGMLVVPLNSLIQFNAPRKEIGKILAANNFVQNCFMFSFLILTVVLGIYQVDSRWLINGLFAVAFVAAVHTIITMPQSLIRYCLYVVTSKFYRVYVHDLKNLPSSGGVLLLGNHVSFIDWAILQVACPRPIRFVMDRSIYEMKYLSWFFKFFKVIPIARGASHEALQTVHDALNNGEVVALFPEGRLSKNGQIGKFNTGFERSAQDANAVIIPFYLHGLWGSKASYASRAQGKQDKLKDRRVHVVFGEPLAIESKAPVVLQKVQELSIKAWNRSIESMGNLQTEWLNRAKKSANEIALVDDNDKAYSYNQLAAVTLFLKAKLKPMIEEEQAIGLLLPTQSAGVIANLAVLASAKTVVNLNYTATDEALLHAVKQANIQCVITSKAFIKKLTSKGLHVDSLSRVVQFIYLEDLIHVNSKKAIIYYSVLLKILPTFVIRPLFLQSAPIESTAAILFSSGSEGKPKGIELTHANLLSNIHQVSAVIGIKPDDKMLNCLPLFHAFGLTVTTLLPLIKGIPMVCQPDPTKSLAQAKQIFQHRITIFCSTSSLLGLMCRNPKIHPQMLASLRFVIAGAEKLSNQVRHEFKEKFSQEIYEGYGATEVSPVASCNLPDVISKEDWHIHHANKVGTVGLPLPGCAFKVVDPETFEELPIGEAGLILIGGTQVMKGYLNDPEKTKQVLIKAQDYSWYKSGDKGYLDEEGFLTIVDRYSRFAKIAGEMISLTEVEQAWQNACGSGEMACMAIALNDDKKGEKLALLYAGNLDEAAVKQRLLQSPLPKLMLPEIIMQLSELPKLGSGKKDYLTAKQLLTAVQTTPLPE
ncbi:acyl-[ACP]--phospholipid O-acyltransferase [Legionella sp. W05-934-2]|uniref:acyl-[ACP]--phospholipid O-acyltransferase n=1 Tax=Legionella sp. W05-934-2 TaxID=1198649 RepID=UPI0034618F0B